ncbi:MAG: endonuclease/exonuclease/phosphatase family protein [Thermoleophilia bacterium]|nr:endonuclease/exonuclease/phosphatase family protein [Thermoleophilia bacterium]
MTVSKTSGHAAALPIHTTADVRSADGVDAPSGDRALPDIPGSSPWQPGAYDRVGRSVHSHPFQTLALGAVGAAAGVLGMRLLGRGAVLQSLGGLAAGLVGGAAGAWTLDRLRSPDTVRPGEKGAPRSNAPAPSTTVAADERLKVMTFNIRGSIGPTGFGSSGGDLDAVAATIRQEDPDIVLLQEVDRFAARSTWHDNLDGLAERLHPDSAVESAPFDSITGRQQTTAVLTFNGSHVAAARGLSQPDPHGTGAVRRTLGMLKPIDHALEDHGITWLEDAAKAHPGFEQRGVTDTIVTTPGGTDVRVLSAHERWAGSDGDFPAMHVEPLARALGAWDGPTILGGDFNTGSTQRDGRRETGWLRDEAGLVDSQTMAGQAPGTRQPTIRGEGRHDIDRIYASGDHFTTVESHRVTDGPASSDHYALVSTLETVPD